MTTILGREISGVSEAGRQTQSHHIQGFTSIQRITAFLLEYGINTSRTSVMQSYHLISDRASVPIAAVVGLTTHKALRLPSPEPADSVEMFCGHPISDDIPS